MKLHLPSTGRTAIQKAFTLIEMLLVITIVAVLMTLAIPVTNSVLKSNQITTATQMVVDQLTLARQNALTNNRVVEVRFYEFSNTEAASEDLHIGAIQAFVFDETNTISKPLSEISYLPDGAILSQDISLSTILEPSRERKTGTFTAEDPLLELPRSIGKNYRVFSLRFRPDGSTDLGGSSAGWFLTIHGANEKSSPPPNFATVQIDPFNGALRLYRPS